MIFPTVWLHNLEQLNYVNISLRLEQCQPWAKGWGAASLGLHYKILQAMNVSGLDVLCEQVKFYKRQMFEDVLLRKMLWNLKGIRWYSFWADIVSTFDVKIITMIFKWCFWNLVIYNFFYWSDVFKIVFYCSIIVRNFLLSVNTCICFRKGNLFILFH